MFPGFSLPSSYGHPSSYDKENYGTKNFDGTQCTLVRVNAEITDIQIVWEGQKSDFEDWDDYAEVEVIYKIWEPKHVSFPKSHWPHHLANPGKVVDSIQIDDLQIQETIGDKYKASRSTEYVDGESPHPHYRYVHLTCLEDLQDILFGFSVAEIDGDGFSKKHQRDAILGGPELELKVLEAMKDYGKPKFQDPASRMVQEVLEKFTLETVEDTGMIFHKKTEDKFLKAFLDEDLMEKGIIKIGGKKALGKIAGYVFGGPIGWTWFVIDTIWDIKDFKDWVEGENQFLGSGVWREHLSDYIDKEEYVTFITERPLVAITPKASDGESIIVFYKMGDNLNPDPFDHNQIKQFGTAAITVKLSVTLPKCSTDSSSSYSWNNPKPNLVLSNPPEEFPNAEITFIGNNYDPTIHFILEESVNSIPEWIKNNAQWWSDDSIGDSEFISGIEFMIENGIIKSPKLQINENTYDQEVNTITKKIPQWIKNNAAWWATGQINDGDFLSGIEFMVLEDIISSPKIIVIGDTKKGAEENIVLQEISDESIYGFSLTPINAESGQYSEKEKILISDDSLPDLITNSVFLVDLYDEIIYDDGDFQKVVVNWIFEYEDSSPAEDLPVLLLVDESTQIYSKSNTDSNGKLSFEFEKEFYSPGPHSVEIFDFVDDKIDFLKGCDAFGVNIPGSERVMVDQSMAIKNQENITFQWHFANEDGSLLPPPDRGDHMLIEFSKGCNVVKSPDNCPSFTITTRNPDENWNVEFVVNCSSYQKMTPTPPFGWCSPGNYSARILGIENTHEQIGNANEAQADVPTYIGDGDKLEYLEGCAEWKPEYCAEFNN